MSGAALLPGNGHVAELIDLKRVPQDNQLHARLQDQFRVGVEFKMPVGMPDG